MALQVLHVISDLQIGGAGRYLLNLLSGLTERGWDVAVACPGGGRLEQELRKSGYRLYLLDRADASWDWLVLRQLMVLLRQEPYRLVHTHASLAGRVAARLVGGSKIVLTRHGLGAETRAGGWRRGLNTAVSKLLTDRIIAVSAAVAVRLQEEGVPPGQITVIPNGIDVAEFSHRSGQAVRDELGLGGRTLIGMIARLVPEKAPEVFVRAAALVKRQYPDVMFIIAGSGPLQEKLTGLIRDHDLNHEFKLLGFRPDIADVIGALDIAVLTSSQEGLPLALLEVMAAGKPVVVTEVGGMAEVVQTGRTGWLVPPHNPAAVAQALLHLLEHKEQALAWGRAGQELVQQKFSRAAMAARTAELYSQLLEN